MKINTDDIKELLLSVEKPARYTGGEFGAPVKRGDEKFNFCMCFPDLYEVGTSNLGVKIVAESLRRRGYFSDFCYAPAKDFGDGLRARGIPLYSLSAFMPLGEFDMLGFSLSYELSYTNVLYMLDLAGIPFLRKDRRGKGYPLIVFGGPCAFNPEPLADFADIIFIGDGEQTDAAVADLYVKHGGANGQFFGEVAKIEGVYLPELTTPVYEGNKLVGFSGVTRVKKATVTDLDGAVFPETFAVPNCESVHDRAVIEVMRGCYRGCRFCQAGFIYRPVRKRKRQTLVRQACSLIKNTGYEEVSLNSLSTGDYGGLKELLKELKESLPQGVTFALPSLRVDSFDGVFAQDSRRISLTFAPEAGTQRLRDVINKDVTEEEVLRAAQSAFDAGYSAVKLYFMLGLPTERDEDLKGIRALCDKIKGVYNRQKRARALRITVSCSTFIPKPFTPFQWEAQARGGEVAAKQKVLRDSLFVKGITLSWGDSFSSMLEGVLARGDRRLAPALVSAYKNGCIFDGWKVCEEGWRKAFADNGVDPEEYLRERGEQEVLPWDFIDCGVDRSFFAAERRKAYSGEVTGSCKDGCKGCGLQKDCPAAGGEL